MLNSDDISNDSRIIELPMLPMRNMVVFPHMTIPFFIGRQQSIEALETALAGNRKIFVVCQKDPHIEIPQEEDLYEMGTVGNILQIMRLPKGTIKVLFSGKERARRVMVDLHGVCYKAQVEIVSTIEEGDPELQTLSKTVKEDLKSFLKRNVRNVDCMEKISSGNHTPGEIADMISPLLSFEIEQQQELLAELDSKTRLEKVYARILEEEERKKIEQKLKERIQGQIGKSQKEYYLNEQMKAIQKELGAEDLKEEIEEFEQKARDSKMPEETFKVVKKELKKLKMMPSTSSEANIVRTFVDWLTSVPWQAETEDKLVLDHARKILDEDHYGLEKAKGRILEYIAVANLIGSLRGPIICFTGPPGVGKSSLARSIARALNRKFVRMSLGGVRDEAEIKGHRRTYIGAMPGKIIQSMKKAKTNNPVMLLDEIDKISKSHMGDPAAALLEVLDPEQNNGFMDHYLEVEYDLSNAMFICTANVKDDIPLPLMDRMEIIPLSGYSEFEKEKIALRYLAPKQVKENGLKSSLIEFDREGVLEIIRSYTREAGVRSLERTIAKVCRKVAIRIVENKTEVPVKITKDQANELLGVKLYKYGEVEGANEVGIINGLAWTPFGGEVLTIEVDTMRGSGKIHLTGKLGDVMKESAYAAFSYVRANANSLGIYSKVFSELDIHVHVPEGATPKDGPSAGVAMAVALISAFTGIPVRKDAALTGEITLRGKILPIGGLKEKLLAAKRSCIPLVIIPKENKKDLVEIDDEIKESLEIKMLKDIREVLGIILERLPRPVDDDELEENMSDRFSPSESISRN